MRGLTKMISPRQKYFRADKNIFVRQIYFKNSDKNVSPPTKYFLSDKNILRTLTKMFFPRQKLFRSSDKNIFFSTRTFDNSDKNNAPDKEVSRTLPQSADKNGFRPTKLKSHVLLLHNGSNIFVRDFCQRFLSSALDGRLAVAISANA